MTITSERMAGKKPNPVDAHVGSRVRLRRMLLGMSQERLGESMGLTFQQVQKYEKGVNRIGASRLFQISKILDVPVQFFFEEAPHIPGDGSRRAAWQSRTRKPSSSNSSTAAKGLS